MSRFFIPLLLVVFSFHKSSAQYYNSALGLNGTALQNALQAIISNGHLTNTYGDLWIYYGSTDIKSNNKVWDIYSDKPGNTPPYTFTYSTDQCSNSPNTEGVCYNREHTWPASYFNSFYPMYADLFQVLPTDALVNNKRNNFPYGKVNSANWTSQNGSKLGVGTTYSSYTASNPNHWEFEPIDSFKGDVARIYFYMCTRYKGQDGSWENWEMANGAALKPEAITLLLNWHHLDPVSQKEIDRNNAVKNIQGNRNPFVDYPIFADCIWGTADCTPLAIKDASESSFRLYPNPASDLLYIQSVSYKHPFEIYSSLGQKVMQGELSEYVSLSSLASGTYVIRIHQGDQLIQHVFQKQ